MRRTIAGVYDLGTLDRSPLEIVQISLEGELDEIDKRLVELNNGVITLQKLDELEELVQQLEKLPLVAITTLELRLLDFTQKMVRLNELHKEAVQNAVDAVQSSRLKILENPPRNHDGILGAVLFEVIIAVLPYSLIVKAALLPLRGLLNFVAKAMARREFGSVRNFLLAFNKPRLSIYNSVKAERKLIQDSRRKQNEIMQEYKKQLSSLETKRLEKYNRSTRSRRGRRNQKAAKRRIDRRIDKQIKNVNENTTRRIEAHEMQEAQHKKAINAILAEAKPSDRSSAKHIDIAKELTKLLKPKALEQNKMRMGGLLADDIANAKKDVLKDLPKKTGEKSFANIYKSKATEQSNPPRLNTGQSAQKNDTQNPAANVDEIADSEKSTTFYDSTKLPLDIAFKIYVQNFYDQEIALLLSLTDMVSELRSIAEEGPGAAWLAFDQLKEEIDGEKNSLNGVFDMFTVFIRDEASSARDLTYTDQYLLRHELTAQYEFIIWSILLVDEFELRAYEPEPVKSEQLLGPGDKFTDSMKEVEIQNYKEIPLEDALKDESEGNTSFVVAVPKSQSKSEIVREVRPTTTLLKIPTYRYIFERFGNNESNPTFEDLALNMKKCAEKYLELI